MTDMDKDIQMIDTYSKILRTELQPALGCTEPIAIAYAAARAVEILDTFPEKMVLSCSGNVIKNVKGVAVPNSGGLKGLEISAALGAVGGQADKKLQVLEAVGPDQRERARQLVADGFCECRLKENVPPLCIGVEAFAGGQSAYVEIAHEHVNIVRIMKNGEVLFSQDIHTGQDSHGAVDAKSLLNIRDIITFAGVVDIDTIEPILEPQISCNEAIADEGLRHSYGMDMGKRLLASYNGDDVRIRARARAAAGSDARMSGCSLPVIINSGSGNQGMTVSLPVIEYARTMGSSREELLRALAVANLVAIHQKKYIGSLSAFCGVVSAAAGAACGISFLHGGRYDAISRTITNTLATVGGMVCDGAKPSCAAKISTALDCAITSFEIGTFEHDSFKAGEGLVAGDVESTIRNFGRVGAQGMKETDRHILSMMLQK